MCNYNTLHVKWKTLHIKNLQGNFNIILMYILYANCAARNVFLDPTQYSTFEAIINNFMADTVETGRSHNYPEEKWEGVWVVQIPDVQWGMVQCEVIKMSLLPTL